MDRYYEADSKLSMESKKNQWKHINEGDLIYIRAFNTPYHKNLLRVIRKDDQKIVATYHVMKHDITKNRNTIKSLLADPTNFVDTVVLNNFEVEGSYLERKNFDFMPLGKTLNVEKIMEMNDLELNPGTSSSSKHHNGRLTHRNLKLILENKPATFVAIENIIGNVDWNIDLPKKYALLPGTTSQIVELEGAMSENSKYQAKLTFKDEEGKEYFFILNGFSSQRKVYRIYE